MDFEVTMATKILIIIGFIILFYPTTDKTTTEVKISECDMHKWLIKGEDPNTYMVCDKCGFLPGCDGNIKDITKSDDI